MKVKFCGMRRMEDIEAVNRLRPDYIGFVFVEGRKRYVSPETALRLKAALRPEIRAVGVFLNDPVEKIAAIADSGAIDLIQLHGQEDEEFLAALRQKTALPIIRAGAVHDAADAARIAGSSAEYILLDSGAGSGETFDWSVLQSVGRPFFLAGGLTPENVAAAIAQVHPWGVDLSSGIETDGVKDPEKMERFLKACGRI